MNKNIQLVAADMSEEEILNRLLNLDEIPERTIVFERAGIPIKLKALTYKQIVKLRERCRVTVKNENGEVTRELDDAAWNTGLIKAASVKPNWNAPELRQKYQASSAEEVMQRMLLAYELNQIVDHILDLSGYNTRFEEVKNSLEAAE